MLPGSGGGRKRRRWVRPSPLPFHLILDTDWLKSTWMRRSSMSTLSILKKAFSQSSCCRIKHNELLSEPRPLNQQLGSSGQHIYSGKLK